VAKSVLSTEQAMPVPNDSPSVQGMVRADLETREQIGRERYGTALQPHNGRDALRDAYEEALHLSCYLRLAIAERRREDVDAAVAQVQHRYDHDRERWSDLERELRTQLAFATKVRDGWVAEARALSADRVELGDRLKATSDRASELVNVLDEVLRTFVHPGHPGRACVQSGWIEVERVGRWRDALRGTAGAARIWPQDRASDVTVQATGAVQRGLDSHG
jgi:hypothetical protein